MSSNISNAIQKLKKSPIFALSLGGKELSHSNFWAWLIDLKIGDKHPFIEVFMPGFSDNGFEFAEVKREEGNRDISVHYNNKGGKLECFVIENKLKSTPTKEQLEKYKNDLKEEFGGGLLTGLRETLESLPEGWRFCDYNQIAKAIEDINKEYKKTIEDINEEYKDENEKDYNYILDYIENIRNISEVINNHIDEHKGIYVWEDKELDEVRLADIYLKYQAEIFKDNIEKRITDNSYKTNWGNPFVYTSFNNKKPTITVIYQEVDKEKKTEDPFESEIGRIGVQIEGNTFRIYAGPSKQGNKDFKFEELKSLGWFEEFDHKKEKKIDGKVTSMKGGREDKRFCQYKTRDYKHMYQYWDIDEGTTYEKLTKEILEKLKDAKNIIDNKELSFR